MNWLKGRKRWQRVLLVVAAFMIIIGILELVLPKGIMEKVGYVGGVVGATYLILETAGWFAESVSAKKSK